MSVVLVLKIKINLYGFYNIKTFFKRIRLLKAKAIKLLNCEDTFRFNFNCFYLKSTILLFAL